MLADMIKMLLIGRCFLHVVENVDALAERDVKHRATLTRASRETHVEEFVKPMLHYSTSAVRFGVGDEDFKALAGFCVPLYRMLPCTDFLLPASTSLCAERMCPQQVAVLLLCWVALYPSPSGLLLHYVNCCMIRTAVRSHTRLSLGGKGQSMRLCSLTW